MAGQQFDYSFDTIGDRKSTLAGGDQHGWNQRLADYTVNSLNQYTSRNVPGYVEITGLSFATNTVTVNGATAYRKGEYFWDELGVNNSAAPLWEGVTVAATGQSTVSGNVFVPKTPEAFRYDADGNLLSDGRWNFTWDAENRLVTMVSATSVGPQQLIKFEYDWQGRRIRKEVWSNTSGSGSPVLDERFIYDGWNCIAVLNPQSSVLQSFLWGLDLSGTTQGAGGVGGLVKVYDSAGASHNFVGYDGNGNVALLGNGPGDHFWVDSRGLGEGIFGSRLANAHRGAARAGVGAGAKSQIQLAAAVDSRRMCGRGGGWDDVGGAAKTDARDFVSSKSAFDGLLGSRCA